MQLRCDAVDVCARPRTAGLVCTGCGCTDDNACPGGCWWVSRDPPLCSSCAANALRDASIASGGLLADGFFSRQHCPAAAASHLPIFVDEESGYCAACRTGFVL